MKTAIFDLEMQNLYADFGLVICGVIKESGGATFTLRLDDDFLPGSERWADFISRDGDSFLVKDLARYLNQYDLWVTYNGTDFDIPFLNSRLLYYRLPPLDLKKHIDVLKLARKHLRVHSRRLINVAEFFGLPPKELMSGKIWIPAMAGDKASIDQIVEHCVKDVEALEGAYELLKGFVSKITRYA